MKAHEKKKEAWTDGLKCGRAYQGFIGAASQVRRDGDFICFVLKDRKGSIPVRVHSLKAEEPFSDGDAVICDFRIVREKGSLCAIAGAVRKAGPAGDAWHPLDLSPGLSERYKRAYERLILQAAESVGRYEAEETKKDGRERHLHALLKAYLTKEEFEALSLRPASVSGPGRYLGGALALVGNCTSIAKDCVIELRRLSCGLYAAELDYSLVVSATLLCMSGIRDYVGEDLLKTKAGFCRGYFSLMQERLLPLMAECGLTDWERDRLLNVLQCMRPGAGAIRGVTLEASVCRSAYGLFCEVDEAARRISEGFTQEEDLRGYAFDEELSRPFLLDGGDGQEKEKGEKEVGKVS